jgi:D-serine deaminase-like pyridoxal phosphate-dependent protein
MINIQRPTLIIDESKAKANVQNILDKAKRHSLSVRPHFKTHQSHDIGGWYRELGVEKITVSSVVMAQYFAEDDWDDILVAFPYNPLEAEVINALADKVQLGILIESKEALAHASKNVQNTVNYHIAIDIGYHRTGVSWENHLLVEELMGYPTHHRFAGLLTHAGHTYDVKGKEEVERVHQGSLGNLDTLLKNIGKDIHVSYGDTPSCSISESWRGIDELRCGNMVYYDLTQVAIGSCTIDQVAVAIACPVVAKHPDRDQLIIYGGGVHFSKDRLETADGVRYGQAVRFTSTGWEPIKGVEIISLSQEHGKVSVPKSFIETCQIGDIIGFLPVHSCMSADLLTQQQTFAGQAIHKMMIK